MLIDNTAKEIELTEDTEVQLGDIIVENDNHYLIVETPDWQYGFINLSDSTYYEALYEDIEELIKEQFLNNDYDKYIIRKGQAKLTIT